MFLLLWMCSVIGFVFVIRTLERLQRNKLIQKRQLTKIGTLYLVVFLMMALIARVEARVFIVALVVVATSICVLEIVFRYQRERRFQSGFERFVDESILLMNSGQPFRFAWLKAMRRQSDDFVRDKLEQIYRIVVFSQHSEGSFGSTFGDFVVEYLKRVDKESHLAVERLKALRYRLKIESEFRRKSGQVLLQIRMQAVILLFLYVFCLVFTLYQFDGRELIWLLGTSMSLFFTGLITILVMGRRIKWKV